MANQDEKWFKTSGYHPRRTVRTHTLRCTCGVEILVIPDLPEMDKAIKEHMIEHKRATGHRLKEDTILRLLIKTITEYQI